MKKRLAAYSSFAAVMIAANYEKAEAQIVYHDFDPNIFLSGPSSGATLDLNNDGILDFSFSFSSSSDQCPFQSAQVSGENGALLLASGSGALGFEKAMMISSGQMYWVDHGQLERLFCTMGSASNSYCDCNWEGNFLSEGYLGIQFIDSIGIHYGWIRLGLKGQSIKEYAYNNVANESILAGQAQQCDSFQAVITPSGPVIVCGSGNVTLSGADSAAIKYQWFKNGSLIPNVSSATYNVSTSGLYAVGVYENGCIDISNTVSVQFDPVPPAPAMYRYADTVYSTKDSGNQWYVNYLPIPGETNKAFTIEQTDTYQLTFTDSLGCVSPFASNLLQTCDDLVYIKIVADATPDSICEGETVLLATNFSGFASYQWYLNGDSIDNATATNYLASDEGNYTVAVSFYYGCMDTSGIWNLTIFSDPVPQIFQNGDSLTSNYALGNQWYLNGQPIPGAVNQLFISIQSGFYQVQVTDANGCMAICDSIYYIATETFEQWNEALISTYQNQQSLTIQVDPSLKGSQILLYDILGNLKQQLTATTNTAIFSIENFASGIYFLQVMKDEKQWVKKIFIQ